MEWKISLPWQKSKHFSSFAMFFSPLNGRKIDENQEEGKGYLRLLSQA